MRRLTLRQQKPWSALLVDDIMDHAKSSPRTLTPDMALVEAVCIMEEKHIRELPVTDGDGRLVGLFHLHQAIKHLLETLFLAPKVLTSLSVAWINR